MITDEEMEILNQVTLETALELLLAEYKHNNGKLWVKNYKLVPNSEEGMIFNEMKEKICELPKPTLKQLQFCFAVDTFRKNIE